LERKGVYYSISHRDHPVTKLIQSPLKAPRTANVLISLNTKQVSSYHGYTKFFCQNSWGEVINAFWTKSQGGYTILGFIAFYSQVFRKFVSGVLCHPPYPLTPCVHLWFILSSIKSSKNKHDLFPPFVNKSTILLKLVK
jgi:hypothetical protein